MAATLQNFTVSLLWKGIFLAVKFSHEFHEPTSLGTGAKRKVLSAKGATGNGALLRLLTLAAIGENSTISLPPFTIFSADPEGQAGLASGEMTKDDQT
jgi:hypothetical protein